MVKMYDKNTYEFTNTIAIQLPLIESHMEKLETAVCRKHRNPPVEAYDNPLLLASLANLGDERDVSRMLSSVEQLGYLSKPKG